MASGLSLVEKKKETTEYHSRSRERWMGTLSFYQFISEYMSISSKLYLCRRNSAALTDLE